MSPASQNVQRPLACFSLAHTRHSGRPHSVVACHREAASPRGAGRSAHELWLSVARQHANGTSGAENSQDDSAAIGACHPAEIATATWQDSRRRLFSTPGKKPHVPRKGLARPVLLPLRRRSLSRTRAVAPRSREIPNRRPGTEAAYSPGKKKSTCAGVIRGSGALPSRGASPVAWDATRLRKKKNTFSENTGFSVRPIRPKNRGLAQETRSGCVKGLQCPA